MFDVHKTLNRTTNTTHKAEDNLYTVLNDELNRLHSLFLYAFKNGHGVENLNIFWKKLQEIQNILTVSAEKGMTEDVQKQLHDLQSTVGDIMLTGSK